MRGDESVGDPIEVTIAVANALDEIGVPYFVGGSIAGALYGVARATIDVDFVVDLRSRDVPPLVARLGGSFHADDLSIEDAVRRRTSTNLIHLPTMFKVDLFVLKDRPWDREQMARRQWIKLGSDRSRGTAFATPEDTILAKLEWYRKGGEVSDRQWRDVLGIIAVQGDRIDRSYLEHWARELGLDDLLGKALA